MSFDGRARWWMLGVAVMLSMGCPNTSDAPGDAGTSTIVSESGETGTDEATMTDDAAAMLILEDEHSAVWMVADNAYMEAADENWQKWSGILFQLGAYWKYTGQNEPSAPETERMRDVLKFEELRITGENGFVALTPSDFTWINVVGENEGSPPVADPKLVEYLFPAPWMDEGDWTCAPVDSCADRVYPPPEGWNCESPLTSVPSSCLRRRSLHAYYRAERIVTYWQGQNGWDLHAAWRTGVQHNRYEFSLADPVSVTVYDQREPAARNDEVQALGRITEIRILKPADVTHGEIHAPPTNSYPPVSGGG